MGWLTIRHPVTGGTARIAESTLPPHLPLRRLGFGRGHRSREFLLAGLSAVRVLVEPGDDRSSRCEHFGAILDAVAECSARCRDQFGCLRSRSA